MFSGLVTPQFKSQQSEAPARASYGSTNGQHGHNGYPVQVGAPPSLAQLQRHMMGGKEASAKEKDIEMGEQSSDHNSEAMLGSSADNKVRYSESNNTLSSRNLELHDSEVMPEPGHGGTVTMELDQTTMIGSALDLDSLDGGHSGDTSPGHVTGSSEHVAAQQTGSQIGLLKLSAV